MSFGAVASNRHCPKDPAGDRPKKSPKGRESDERKIVEAVRDVADPEGRKRSGPDRVRACGCFDCLRRDSRDEQRGNCHQYCFQSPGHHARRLHHLVFSTEKSTWPGEIRLYGDKSATRSPLFFKLILLYPQGPLVSVPKN